VLDAEHVQVLEGHDRVGNVGGVEADLARPDLILLVAELDPATTGEDVDDLLLRMAMQAGPLALLVEGPSQF